MNYAEYSSLKSAAIDFIRSTGKFKTPNKIENHGQEWYGDGMILYFDTAATDDKIIVLIDSKGDTHYLNVEGLEAKLKEE